MRVTMKDDGYPWKTIYEGRKKVGRVYRHAAGHYVGKIGTDEVPGATEAKAFAEVAARHFGYASAAELDAKNRRVARTNRMVRAAGHALGDRLLDDMKRGDFTTLDRIPTQHQPAAFGLTLAALTRDMRRK